MSIFRKYLINVFAQGTGRIFTLTVNFLVFVLIARLGSPELFGQYSYTLAFLGVFMVVADFGMSSVLGKDAAQVQGEAFRTYWGNYLILRLGIGFLTIGLAIVAAYGLRKELFPVLILGSLSLPFLAARFFEPVFQVYQRPWFSTYSNIAYSLVYLIFSVACLWSFPSLFMLTAAYIGANVCYVLVAMGFSTSVVRPAFKPRRGLLEDILRLSLPLGVSSIFAMINCRAAIFFLAQMKSDYDVAIYNAAYRFLELAAMLAAMLVTPILPIFSQRADGEREKLKADFVQILELVGIATIPVAVVCPHLSPFLITKVFGVNYAESAPVLNVLAWTGVVVFFSIFSSALTLSLGVVHFAYWNTAVAATLSLALNFALIPQFGSVGSAWAALCAEVLLAGVTLAYAIKHLGNVLLWRRWAKILASNLLVYTLLSDPFLPDVDVLVRAGIALPLYVLCVFRFHLVAPEIVRRFWVRN